MGKLTLFFAIVAIGTFILSVGGILNPSGVLAGLLFGGSIGVLLFIIGPIWLGKVIYRQMAREQTVSRSVEKRADPN